MGSPRQTKLKRGPILIALGVVCLLYLLVHSASSASSALETSASSPRTGNHNALPPLDDLKSETGIVSFQLSTARRLQRLFPYEPALHKKYPRTIWQTWKYTPSDARFSSKFHRATDAWTRLNEGFTHEVLDDNTAASLIRQLYASVPEVVDAYFAMPKPILRADFFRYLILLARGGVYSDIDTTALKGVSKWFSNGVSDVVVDEDGNDKITLTDEQAAEIAKTIESTTGLIVGIEADPDRPDWHDWYARRVQFCQWTILAKKGHPALLRIVSHITTETLRRKITGTIDLPKTKEAGSQIMDWTGPGVWTDTVFEYLSSIQPNTDWHNVTGIRQGKVMGDVVVLPITSFSPGVGTMGAFGPDHPHAFVYHIFEGSWKPANERHIGG
ncbi:nucleotide-diphospho-sugar transferase [Lipomyces tetrasporus]|uniref:Nucleotide-diphospho-sugar transferase n=1 Tax=Lipomyces tetrasporus TaxID=54092 RepID=A0AAD7QUN5_9ASCO|nr:nucleotide-diphospho-sugar transferase [Lipomyces tetrasporus]KAJ8101833.1 nucleotide-diphospho-sugar transferase [Lipomyces tetrasporus]